MYFFQLLTRFLSLCLLHKSGQFFLDGILYNSSFSSLFGNKNSSNLFLRGFLYQILFYFLFCEENHKSSQENNRIATVNTLSFKDFYINILDYEDVEQSVLSAN